MLPFNNAKESEEIVVRRILRQLDRYFSKHKFEPQQNKTPPALQVVPPPPPIRPRPSSGKNTAPLSQQFLNELPNEKNITNNESIKVLIPPPPPLKKKKDNTPKEILLSQLPSSFHQESVPAPKSLSQAHFQSMSPSMAPDSRIDERMFEREKSSLFSRSNLLWVVVFIVSVVLAYLAWSNRGVEFTY